MYQNLPAQLFGSRMQEIYRMQSNWQCLEKHVMKRPENYRSY